MKKAILTGMVLVLMLFILSSCGVSQEEYAKISDDLAIAQTEITSLQAAIEKLEQVKAELEVIKRASATPVVAASTTTDAGKAQADFVADGMDDQVEIQDAINSLPLDGGKVLLLEGTFIIGESIILGDNVILAGLGASTILKIEDNRGGDFFLVENDDSANGNKGITIQDITFDGNMETQATGYQHGIGFTRASTTLITRCIFREFSGAGILGNRLRDSSVTENVFERNDYGINIEGSISEGNSFANNSFLYNDTTDIRLANAVRNTVMGNTHTGDTATSWRLGGATYTTLTGNVSEKKDGYGLYMDSKSNYNTITANIAEGGTIGFSVSDSHHNNFVGNIAKGAKYYGFGFDTGSSYNLVSGNTAEDNGNEGIMFHTNASYNIATGNRLMGNNHQGISMIANSNYNIVTGNSLIENGQESLQGQMEIAIINSSHNLVTMNICETLEGRTYAIVISGGDSVGNAIINNIGNLYDGGTQTHYEGF